MVMPASVDASGDIDVQPADEIGGGGIWEAARQFLRDRGRARGSQRAVVQPWARDNIGDEIDVGRRQADFIERLPERRQVAARDMRQGQVLLVTDTDFAE